MDFYIGQAGIEPDKFWGQTWKENALLGESYIIKTNLNWEMTRYLASWIHNTNITKKGDAKRPDQLFSLPQDSMSKTNKEPQSTKEQKEAFEAKVNKLLF